MKKIKVGYIPLAKASFDFELAEEYRKKALKLLNIFDNIELVSSTRLITLDSEVGNEIDMFKEKHIELLIMHFCSFSLGAMTPSLVSNLKVPIILLSTPEPNFNGNKLRLNSFCALNMNSFTLHQMKIKHRSILKSLDDITLKDELGKIFLAISTLKSLKNNRVGLVGSRSPGFYTSNFNELKLMNELGVEVEHIDISRVYHEIEKVDEKVVIAKSESLIKSINNRSNVEKKHLYNLIRMCEAFSKLAKDFRLDAFAIKCWPEFHSDFKTTPCAAIGMMNSKIPTAAEGDVYGVVTMMIQKYITGKTSFFADYIHSDIEKNTGVFWHCGCASMELAGDKSKIFLDNYRGLPKGDPNSKGCIMNFQIYEENKRVTVNRLGPDSEGNLRLLNLTGKNVKGDYEISGNYCQVKFDSPVESVIKGILDDGFEHHYSLTMNDVSDVIEEISYWKNFKLYRY